MVLHFHFTFKPFLGHAQKRKRASERRELSHQNSHWSSSLQVTLISPHLLSLTVVWSPSQTQTEGEFSFHDWPFYTSDPHTSPHLTSPHLTSPHLRSTHKSNPHPFKLRLPKSTTHPPDPPLGSNLSIIYIYIYIIFIYINIYIFIYFFYLIFLIIHFLFKLCIIHGCLRGSMFLPCFWVEFG